MAGLGKVVAEQAQGDVVGGLGFGGQQVLFGGVGVEEVGFEGQVEQVFGGVYQFIAQSGPGQVVGQVGPEIGGAKGRINCELGIMNCEL